MSARGRPRNEAKTITNVIEMYQSYLNTQDVAPYITEDFENAVGEIMIYLEDNDIRTATELTISLFEYLNEHRAVDPRIKYPGPTENFKRLVESYETE